MDQRIGRYPLPPDDPLVELLAEAAQHLRVKLGGLDVSRLGISEYSRNYFQGTLVNGVSKLNLYAYLIFLGLRGGSFADGSALIVDYGGGNGLLSLLAREAGFGAVVYTDIDEGSAKDARRLALAVGLEADHYVVGDLDQLITFFQGSTVESVLLCSYDVIEHVYDVDAFLRSTSNVNPGPLRVVMGSGANTANPRLRRRLMAFQRQIETEDRAPDVGHKQRDAAGAYARIRAQMIRRVSGVGPSQSFDALVAGTRGMAQPDIEAVVQRYLDSGEIPPPPAHPTNTCDPYTGNWAEHLMDPFALADTLSSVGLRGRVLPGFYNPYLGWKGAVSAGLNLAIKAAGRRGLALAPYYVLIGDRDRA